MRGVEPFCKCPKNTLPRTRLYIPTVFIFPTPFSPSILEPLPDLTKCAANGN